MSSKIASNYFMNDSREFQRLSDKVDPTSFINKYFPTYVSSNEKINILDVGGGSFVIAKSMASLMPNAHIFAIDSDRIKVRTASENIPENMKIHCANAYAIPFNDNVFDLVFSRFLFEYLENPQQALCEMIRVCKPGGKIIIQDLDGQIINHYPEDDKIQSETNAVINFLAKSGFDIFIGRKLYNLFYINKLKKIETIMEPYHFYPGRIDDKNYKLWELKLDIALPQIALALGSIESAINYKNSYLAHLAREDVFSFSNVITVTGVK